MRVLFRGELIPGARIRRPDGSVGEGAAVFTARIWDPDEQINGFYHPKPISDWRREWSLPDGSVSVPAPSNIAVPGQPIAAAVIPAAVLDALPAGTLIEVAWGVYYGGGS